MVGNAARGCMAETASAPTWNLQLAGSIGIVRIRIPSLRHINQAFLTVDSPRAGYVAKFGALSQFEQVMLDVDFRIAARHRQRDRVGQRPTNHRVEPGY